MMDDVIARAQKLMQSHDAQAGTCCEIVSHLVDELTQRRAEVGQLQGQLARVQTCR